MKRTVLVVEDDDVIRRLLVEYLLQHSHIAVDGARDGVDALYRISQRAYSVVILDLMMPRMSGVDLLDSLVAISSDPSLKPIQSPPAVIVITAAPADEYPDDALMRRSSLIRGVFRKPLDLTELASFVEVHVKREPPPL